MTALFERLTGLTLLDPWLLLLGLLIPAALFARRRKGASAICFASGRFLGLGRPPSSAAAPPPESNAPPPEAKMPARSWRVRLLPIPPGLQVFALLLVVLALARPALRVQIPFEKSGIDIILCLDTSSSMTANDMDRQRSRLDVARGAAQRFIAGRPDDRIGLVCFARFPDLRCPLTLDHAALTAILDGVTIVENDGPEDATGIGTAVARAAQILSRSRVPSKVVILLTDGEENVATAQTPGEIAPLHAAQLCGETGVRVYTIAAGVGKRDRSGDWVALDNKQIEGLAVRTGGRFFEARDARSVAGVYSSIDDLERVALEEPRYRVEERFVPFLVAALLLFAVSRLLRSTLLEVLP
jgi:Ca-activated chloride channel homolog